MLTCKSRDNITPSLVVLTCKSRDNRTPSLVVLTCKSRDKEPFIALFYTGILGSIIFSIIVLFNWQPILDSSIWFVLFFLGFIGYLSHFIFAYVLQSLDLSFITNFQYSQLIWASLINVYFFNDPLSTSKIIGVILIIFFGVMFVQNRFKN